MLDWYKGELGLKVVFDGDDDEIGDIGIGIGNGNYIIG